MKLAIMQPYFFPYLGYYSLIKQTDRFVLLDEVQFIRHGWIERNRILKPVEGWQYIAVPLEKKNLATAICDIQIRTSDDWKDRLIRQLDHYKKTAPYFRKTMQVVRESLDIETSSIVKLNENILKKTCDYLGIPLDVAIFSEMNLKLGAVVGPGDWALQISRALEAKEYINPPGGINLFNKSEFDVAHVQLKFLENKLEAYDQKRQSFEAGLSIIDAMMFNDINAINMLIDSIRFVPSPGSAISG